MNIINKNISIQILFILIAIIGINFIYNNNKITATFNFTMEVNNSSTSKLQGQIYYSINNHFYPHKNTPFVIQNSLYDTNKTFSLDIKEKNINGIRFDPLIAKGIVKIYNVSLNSANSNINIDLNNIKEKNMHNIKILKQTKNYIYLKSIGNDPHFILIHHNKPLVKDKLLLKSWIYIIFYSTIYILILYLIYKGLSINIITFESLIVVTIITIYTIFTLLFSKEYMVMSLINLLSILSIIVIVKKGIKKYIKPLLYLILFIITIAILSYISDVANNGHRFNSFIYLAPIMIKIFFIPISMLHKNNIEYKFYKNYIFFLLVTFSLLSTLLHFNILSIDTSFIYGYQMSMSDWTQKNYIIWLMLLFWGYISIDIKINLKNIIFLSMIVITSVYTGYSSSALQALIISFLIFTIMYLAKNRLLVYKFIPYLISIYLILAPIIYKIIISFDYFYSHSHGRGVIYKVALNLIDKHFWFGYGFHSSLNLLEKSIAIPTTGLKDILKSSYHAHSIPLWLWLNFGAIGVLILSLLITISLKKLLSKYNSLQQPAITALISIFIFYTSFSWSGWWPIVLLTDVLFVSMLFLTLQNNKN